MLLVNYSKSGNLDLQVKIEIRKHWNTAKTLKYGKKHWNTANYWLIDMFDLIYIIQCQYIFYDLGLR